MSLTRFLQLTAASSLFFLANGAATGLKAERIVAHEQRATSNTPGALALPLKKVEQNGTLSPSLAKRYVDANILSIHGAAYLVTLQIGTGKTQEIDVLLDTGSFELWVDPICANSDVPSYCTQFGSYDPASSTTSHNLGTSFSIQYGSGGVSGTYYTDNIQISGNTISNQQFGVATTSQSVWFGILGLGRGNGNGFINYNLMIDTMVSEKLINSKLFSLVLGSQGSTSSSSVTGEIIFGGVDINKYAGTLSKVPTTNLDAHYNITLDAIGITKPGGSTTANYADPSFPFSAVVDSGTTLTLLPQALVDKIAADFPGAVSDGSGGYTVDCSYQQQPGTMDFTFGTLQIRVPYSEFIWNSGASCYLGVSSDASIGISILGATFLQGAYVVFDQDNEALYMAQYEPCAADANLVDVPAGVDMAASITGACSVITASRTSSATASATGIVSTVTCTVDPCTFSTTTSTVTVCGSSTSSGLPVTAVQPVTTTTTMTTTTPVVVTVCDCDEPSMAMASCPTPITTTSYSTYVTEVIVTITATVSSNPTMSAMASRSSPNVLFASVSGPNPITAPVVVGPVTGLAISTPLPLTQPIAAPVVIAPVSAGAGTTLAPSAVTAAALSRSSAFVLADGPITVGTVVTVMVTVGCPTGPTSTTPMPPPPPASTTMGFTTSGSPFMNSTSVFTPPASSTPTTATSTSQATSTSSPVISRGTRSRGDWGIVGLMLTAGLCMLELIL